MNSNENFVPYWTMNSREGAIAIIIVGFIFASPAIPAFMLGYHIGEHYIGNNFARWGLSILFFILMYAFVIHIKKTKGLFYAFLIVFSEYFILDYTKMKMEGRDSLVMVDTLKSFIHWGLSLS